MKKKLRDCTYGDIKRYCESHRCDGCLLHDYLGCKTLTLPYEYEEKDLDIEIEISEEE